MTVAARALVRLGVAAGRHPRTTFFVWGLTTVLSLLALTRIHTSGSIQSMLAQDDPATRALTHVVEEFGVLDDLILLVSSPAPERISPAPSTDELRGFAERLVGTIRSSDELQAMCADILYRRPPELKAFVEEEVVPAALWYVDDQTIDALHDRLTMARIREQIQRDEELISTPGVAVQPLVKTILRDPLRLHEILLRSFLTNRPDRNPLTPDDLLLSKDGRTLMIRITGTRPASDLNFARAFTASIRELANRVNSARLQVEVTGAYAIATRSERSIRSDMIVSITTSIILLMLLFMFVYGSAAAFLLAATPVAIGILTAFGISALHFTELTPIVAVIGAVLAGLAIDYSIHLLSHFERERTRSSNLEQCVGHALEHVVPAMSAACVTSVVGFLAIAQSSVPALRHFAILGATGLGCAYFATITLLPAMLQGLGAGAPKLRERVPLRAGVDHALRWVGRRPGLTLLIVGTLAITSGAACILSPGGPLRLEHDLTVMHPRPNEPLDVQHSIAERFGRDPDPFILYFEAANGRELLSIAHRADRALQGEAARTAGIAGAFGPASFLPDPDTVARRKVTPPVFDTERIMADLKSALDDSLFDPMAFDGYFAFLRRLFDHEEPPTWNTLRRYPAVARLMLPSSAIRAANQPTRALATAYLDRPLTGRAGRDRAIEAIRRALSGIGGVTLTGVSVIAYDTEHHIRSDLARLLLIAGAVVLLWLLLYFRNPVHVALAILPAVFGFVCLAAVMAAADIRLNLINLVGLPILVGIGVDDGIFLTSLSCLLPERATQRARLVERLIPACHAVVMTTLTTLLTFGTLTLTSTPAIRSLGTMLAIGMTASLVGTLLLLVPLLLVRLPVAAASRGHGPEE